MRLHEALIDIHHFKIAEAAHNLLAALDDEPIDIDNVADAKDSVRALLDKQYPNFLPAPQQCTCNGHWHNHACPVCDG